MVFDVEQLIGPEDGFVILGKRYRQPRSMLKNILGLRTLDCSLLVVNSTLASGYVASNSSANMIQGISVAAVYPVSCLSKSGFPFFAWVDPTLLVHGDGRFEAEIDILVAEPLVLVGLQSHGAERWTGIWVISETYVKSVGKVRMRWDECSVLMGLCKDLEYIPFSHNVCPCLA